MKRCQSMESLPMLPEEAKLAVSLLRLTLSDKQETTTESEFQSYISQHSCFPYHKAVPFTMAQQKLEVPIKSTATKTTDSTHSTQIKTAQPVRGRRVLRRRCDSSPPAISPEEETRITEGASGYSQSAPSEGRGLFQRLFSKLLRKSRTPAPAAPVEINNNEWEQSARYPHAISNPIPILRKTQNSAEAGHFVRVFATTSGKNNNMGNLIFMSMR